jgi:hypothetical protein
MEKVPPGGIPVLKSYKIHEEQIANVARELQEIYQTRRPFTLPPGRSGKGKVKQKNEKTGNQPRLRVSKPVWETGPVEGLTPDVRNDQFLKMKTPNGVVTAVRCFRCGINFPVPDFHYTKKSGLCIDCWEELVV